MNRKTELTRLLVLTVLAALYSRAAIAGSNSGSAQESLGFSCDNRATFARSFESWCTNVNANIIKSKCVVAVNVKAPIENCGWQGCGFVSFVNERPTLLGNNVIEYGISTPRGVANIPPEWELQNGTVMPKAPFPRNYLTVSQFVAERAKCAAMTSTARNNEIASGSVLGKICGSSDSTMLLNPYYFCMVQQKVLP